MAVGKIIALLLSICSISLVLKWIPTTPVQRPCTEVANPEFIKVFTINATFPVTKYVCKATGLEIIHEQIEGSLVHGYITLATRVKDDDGLPHTLEHLIFHGSEEYPYRGTLNMIVNKCFGSGTNAVTHADHTMFFVKTAGSDGFYKILPVYLDHIFFPILSDASFKTEVHHVTGQGTDAGVVYSEMQSKSSDSRRKAHVELARVFYPLESGYHYEVGGLPRSLRESTNMKKVKNFHKKFYHPRNAQIIITGIIEPEALFQSLEPIMKKLVSRNTVVSKWTKPWSEDVPEVASSLERTVCFPSSHEDLSHVIVSFRGPSVASEFKEIACLRLLLKYLTLDYESPLPQVFVAGRDALASRVFDMLSNNRRPYVSFEFEGVKTNRREEIPLKLRNSLESQLSVFNLTKMNDIITEILAKYNSMENLYEYTIGGEAIKDFLFGTGEQEMFEQRINLLPDAEILFSQTKDFWIKLIQEKILNQKWITIYSVPSKQCLQEFVSEEESRVRERNKTLGESGLRELAKELDDAIKINSRKIPDSILEQVEMPSIESIYYHRINRLQTPDWGSSFKAKLLVDDISSKFVHIRIVMDTTALSAEHRNYLPLFRYYIMDSPILDDNMKFISADEVQSRRSRDLIYYYTTLGISQVGISRYYDYSHLLTIGLKMEMSKVNESIDWIRKLLWKTLWAADDIKKVASRIIRSLARTKQIGEHIFRIMIRETVYKSNSSTIASGALRQHAFLSELLGCLPNCTRNVTAAFDSIQNVITNPANIVVHFATNITTLADKLAETAPPTDIAALLNKTFPFRNHVATSAARLANEPDTAWMIPEQDLRNKTSDFILGLPGGDSTYFSVVAHGPNSFFHSDMPALLTTIQYFTQMDGPFWSKIRGGGYAYSFNCHTSATEGLIYFELYKCSDVVGAYRGAQETVEEHLSNQTQWSEEALKSARSSLIYKYVAAEKSPKELVQVSLQSYYKNTTGMLTREMVTMISRVQLEDVALMTEKYLRPLFNQSFATSVACPLHKRDEILEGFKRLGINMHVISSVSDPFFVQ